MKKSHKINFMNKIKSTSKKALPMVETGLKSVGSTANAVASKSKPMVEKGLSGIYGALATGFDIGLKKDLDFCKKNLFFFKDINSTSII